MHFGYNPRLCFSNSYSETALSEKIQDVQGCIERLAGDSRAFLSRLDSYREGQSDGTEASHTIFRMSPTDDSLLQSCRYDIVSEWALDCLLSACDKREADAAMDFFNLIRTTPWLAPLRGHMFERGFLGYLDGIDIDRDLSIRLLTGSDTIMWTYRGPIPPVRFEDEQMFINEISKAVEDKARIHLVPKAPNFTAVDSIVYVPGEVLTLVQVTISRVHPIAVSGLRSIQKWLRANANTKSLCPNQNQPWRFIFIVPEKMASSFRLQNLQGDTKTEVWAGRVRQYVFGFKGIVR